MKYSGTLLAVKDMKTSLKFYQDVLGLRVTADYGANVTLEGSIFLQTLDTWKSFIHTDRVILPNSAVELYFEEENISAFCDHLSSFDIRYVHPLFEHRWGQRVVRFYDPDGHIIEVGEKLDAVIRRFAANGMSAAETAARMDIPLNAVLPCLNLSTALRLAKAGPDDFCRIRSAYMDIIDNSPDLKRYARWHYGTHPTDEAIQKYISSGEMCMLLDGSAIAGVAAVTPYQSENYHPVQWHVDAQDDEVVTLHLFGILPEYQHAGIGRIMVQRVLENARAKGLKACRLDTLASNAPAQKFYSSLGFICCGTQHWYAENTGWTDFCLYEYALGSSEAE